MYICTHIPNFSAWSFQSSQVFRSFYLLNNDDHTEVMNVTLYSMEFNKCTL